MTDTTMSPARKPGFLPIARWILAGLALIFTAGALGQFFLVGLGMFDDGSRWQDHKTLGSIIGLLPYVMWIPAVVGKTGRRMILATLMLFILFWAQYVFINVDNSIMKAFHPLNGTVLLLLGAWIARESISVARMPLRREGPRPVSGSFSEEAA